MNDIDTDEYLIDFCGDEWYTAGMKNWVAVPVPQAEEVRLWSTDGDFVEVAVYTEAKEHAYTCDHGETQWRTWQDAIKHAVRDHPDRDIIFDYIDREF